MYEELGTGFPRWWQHDSCFGANYLGNRPLPGNTEVKHPQEGALGAVSFVFRTELRRRWRSWVILAPLSASQVDSCWLLQPRPSYRIRLSRVRRRPWLRRPCQRR